MENGKRISKRRKLWVEPEERILVEAWKMRIQQLRGSRKNSHIMKEISIELLESGIIASAEEVQIKIHNMTCRYKKEKAITGPSGGSPSKWHLFGEVHKILGSFKYFNVEHLVEVSIIDSTPTSPATAANNSAESSNSSSVDSANDGTSPPGNKKRKKTIGLELLKRFDKVEEEITKEIHIEMETDNKLVEMEKKRTEALLKMASDTSEVKHALLNFLRRF